jgi:hypothetical protein
MQRAVGSQAQHPIHRVHPAPIEHFRGGVVAVGTQQDLDFGPSRADGADEPAQEGADLAPTRTLAGAQQRGHEAAFAVEHSNRLEPVIVVEGIEQPQLLAAVDAVEEPAPAKVGVSSTSSTMRRGTAGNDVQY